MSTITTTDLEGAVEDAAAHLYVWALKDIPQDLRDALAAARDRETSKTGIRILETIHRNVSIADEQKNLVCQDTGIAVYTCRVGEHFPLHPTRIYAALKAGTARATIEHPLRSNAVHVLTRENTGPNIGYRLPIVPIDALAVHSAGTHSESGDSMGPRHSGRPARRPAGFCWCLGGAAVRPAASARRITPRQRRLSHVPDAGSISRIGDQRAGALAGNLRSRDADRNGARPAAHRNTRRRVDACVPAHGQLGLPAPRAHHRAQGPEPRRVTSGPRPYSAMSRVSRTVVMNRRNTFSGSSSVMATVVAPVRTTPLTHVDASAISAFR